ncbi:RagB/SusD family nutrient uptake outer membrane protein [Pedobacter hiemivivus]|uniref:RagB/SusD family nutrient uptake outer membrane protein n=1 Tax=Pedobacter hiemivivus TaxID=2530454 RepID=A0A4V2MKK0_9SPHI|nr:RagB/SusD family nutrient uptake outer membrane protein [Pedobacter hiemivivus]TCC98456.1 RagB/SusD family nutrient uptake outer membrane protein [Pedobacter hiemivivus]
MKKKILVLSVFLIVLNLVACKKFLMVDPKSTISEDQLFSSESGFEQALNGIYAQAASQSMYGDNLSMGFVSALAQNYNPSNAFFRYKQTTALNYKDVEVTRLAQTVWSSTFNAIAGLNNILAKIDAKKEKFTSNNYHLIKGETLGLRAYLHFDLLRLYGGIYSSSYTKKAIPYRTELNSSSKFPGTVEEVVIAVLKDLKEAETLMENKDGVMTGEKNRRFRMNYVAIKALEARVFLYKGDLPKAAVSADIVLKSNQFRFVTAAEIGAGAASRDRLFSNELVFALRVKKMKDWAETLPGYFKSSGDDRDNLTRTEADFGKLYETSTGGTTDYRIAYLFESDGSLKFPSKYWQTWVQPSGGSEKNRLDQTVPLLRLSEMYYILAEAAGTPQEGLVFLNTVRKNRGIAELPVATITAQKLKDEIAKEYQKEFYAEGQLFYYYKRNATVKMLFSTRSLTESNYIVPIPDNELEFNPNYN